MILKRRLEKEKMKMTTAARQYMATFIERLVATDERNHAQLAADAYCCRFIGAELPATGGEEPQDCESGRSRFRTKTRCCYVYRTFYCRVGE